MALVEAPSAPSQIEEDHSTLCVVCIDAPRTHLVFPCGHRCLCKACADTVDSCPMCRAPKQAVSSARSSCDGARRDGRAAEGASEGKYLVDLPKSRYSTIIDIADVLNNSNFVSLVQTL